MDLKGVRLTRMRRFGEVYPAWVLWRMPGLNRLLEAQMPAGQEHVAWPVVASILCVARFCRPSSERYLQDHFYPASALDDLLGVSCEWINKDRLYGGLDRLLPCMQAIEKHLRQRLRELFKVAFDILLYDLTSTYFEGPCAANPMARLLAGQPRGLPAGGETPQPHQTLFTGGPSHPRLNKCSGNYFAKTALTTARMEFYGKDSATWGNKVRR